MTRPKEGAGQRRPRCEGKSRDQGGPAVGAVGLRSGWLLDCRKELLGLQPEVGAMPWP